MLRQRKVLDEKYKANPRLHYAFKTGSLVS